MDLCWPDTDYPIGDSRRAWGTITFSDHVDAESTITYSLQRGLISESEARFIRTNSASSLRKTQALACAFK